MIDKNQEVINYLIQCPQILNSPLYFNFINAKDDTNQFLTVSSDKYSNKPSSLSFIAGCFENIVNPLGFNNTAFSMRGI